MERKHKASYIIFRILLMPTIISIVAFGILCLASYLVTKEGEHNFTVGFPVKFYEQFRLSGSNTNNWGWLPVNFVINALLTWTLSVGGYFYWLKKFYKPL